MYRKSRRKKRFYPEFYDDDELEELMQTDDNLSNISESDTEELIIEDMQEEKTEAVPIDLAERDSPAQQVKVPADYNDLLYPNNTIPASVSNQLENMQREYLKKKLEISQANTISLSDILSNINESEQNINRNEAANINEHNENGNEMREMRIEIPDEMYVGDESMDNTVDDTNNMPINEVNDYVDDVNENNIEVADDIMTAEEDSIITSQSEQFEAVEPIEINHEEEDEELFEEYFEEELLEEENEHEEDIGYGIETNENEAESIGNSLEFTPFDTTKAIEYAHRWALDRNPNFLNFDELGGDCANYISQILLAGGCPMDYTPTWGWYYSDGNDKSPSWIGVEYLYNYLMREKESGIFAVEISAEEAKVGDIVQMSFNGRYFQHMAFIIEASRTPNEPFSYDSIKINAHSFDSQNRALDTYQWRNIRFLRILGYK